MVLLAGLHIKGPGRATQLDRASDVLQLGRATGCALKFGRVLNGLHNQIGYVLCSVRQGPWLGSLAEKDPQLYPAVGWAQDGAACRWAGSLSWLPLRWDFRLCSTIGQGHLLSSLPGEAVSWV